MLTSSRSEIIHLPVICTYENIHKSLVESDTLHIGDIRVQCESGTFVLMHKLYSQRGKVGLFMTCKVQLNEGKIASKLEDSQLRDIDNCVLNKVTKKCYFLRPRTADSNSSLG
jgi:hypothetical protein